MAKTYGKNRWALFLLILTGIVIGSFAGYLAKDVKSLSWLYYGFDFAIGKKDGTGVVTLDLGVLAIHFGLSIKVTVGSVIGAASSVFIYKKL